MEVRIKSYNVAMLNLKYFLDFQMQNSSGKLEIWDKSWIYEAQGWEVNLELSAYMDTMESHGTE